MVFTLTKVALSPSPNMKYPQGVSFHAGGNTQIVPQQQRQQATCLARVWSVPALLHRYSGFREGHVNGRTRQKEQAPVTDVYVGASG